MDMVARTRQAARECESLMAAQLEKLRQMRVTGTSTPVEEDVLCQLSSEYDRHLSEMERLLDELDRIAPCPQATIL